LSKHVPSILKKSQSRSIAKRQYQAAATLSAPGFTASLTTPSIAGILVTPQTALTFSAYYAGVRVITEDLASLPFCTFQRIPNGGSKAVPSHPVSVLWNRSPDGESTSMNWREAWTGHCLGWGNAFAEIFFDDAGYPERLSMIHPSIIIPKRFRDGRLYYELQTSIGSNASGRYRIIPPWKILHLAGLGFNGLVGYSPVALARESIGLGKAAEQFGASLFGNGAIPHGVLQYPGVLKDEARKNLREGWNQVHQGSASANRIAVLEQGVTWVQTQIQPEDAQFLAARQFQVVEIARILRLAPHKIGDFSQAHLANIEAANDDHIISCIRPWAIRFEQCSDLKLFTREEYDAGFYTKHDFRPLLLKLAKDRADYYRKMFEIGVYTVNEIRELEGLNPISDADGGNLRFRPANEMGLTSPDKAIEEGLMRKGEEATSDKTPRGLMELMHDRSVMNGNGYHAA
jgi:HK97 family phage portal protein